MGSLLNEVDARHRALLQLLDEATRRDRRANPGGARAKTDRFLVAASRHASATTRVFLPVTRTSLSSGITEVRSFVAEAKRLERVLVKAKAKQYGQAQSVNEPWDSVWDGVRRQLERILDMERRLIMLLDERLGTEAQLQLSARFRRAFANSPTRPHPHLPHTGPLGSMARMVSSKLDSVWDEVEGRITTLGPI